MGKRVQDVWSKRWTRAEESGKIERRKEVGTDDESLLKDFVEHPKKWGERVPEISKISEAFPEFLAEFPRYLGEYTPESLKALLEKIGCTVKPLSNGNYTDTSFEKGGGYKVNFGGDGILMYHPEERSHHKIAYYKISTGERGTHHYDVNGNEFDINE